ncbi:helix-turn-helix domain-containing protein [Burkholderia vietnamiensis]|uniref:helix-turn-helix domain-containing protein n=1 Tax=Burkholderia vietnamiensis TaxID=60552 RepID=UPI001B9295B8|nr:helix-turn-helix domain-containing protein [Burkholderia vietnamiensis]MBR8082599.1 helix-turn-helix domain-containing protein [Burkholderia vietnamiensis]
MTREKPTEQATKKLLTTIEAAALLGCDAGLVTRLAAEGRLPRARDSGAVWRRGKGWWYHEEDILELKKGGTFKALLNDRMTLRECAKHLGVSTAQVREAVKNDGLPAVKPHRGPDIYFSRAAVHSYAASRGLPKERQAPQRGNVAASNAVPKTRAQHAAKDSAPPAPAKPAPTSPGRFVLPDVMRNWPILDDRDRAPRRPGYGAGGI